MKFLTRFIVACLALAALDFNNGVQAQSTQLLTFPVSITATTATQLPSNGLVNGLFCIPSTSNTTQVLFGANSTVATNGVPVSNGQIWYAQVNNSNLVWVYSTVTATIACWGN